MLMKVMRIKVFYILLLLLAGISNTCHAQRMDYGSIEALISDHKRIKGPIQYRAEIEVINQELHDNTREQVNDYKDVNEQLDLYTRCFDILDIVYSGLSVSFNVINTYKDIKQKIESIKNLLERYRACIIMKQLGQAEEAGKILAGITDIHSISGAKEWYRDAKDLYEQGTIIDAQDTIIFTIGRDMVLSVKDKCEEIYVSMTTLVGYATGAMACSTEGLLFTIQSLDDQITDLRKIIDRGHFLLWRYIHMRTGYWTKGITRQSKSVRQHARTALERWRRATYGKMGISGGNNEYNGNSDILDGGHRRFDGDWEIVDDIGNKNFDNFNGNSSQRPNNRFDLNP